MFAKGGELVFGLYFIIGMLGHNGCICISKIDGNIQVNIFGGIILAYYIYQFFANNEERGGKRYIVTKDRDEKKIWWIKIRDENET